MVINSNLNILLYENYGCGEHEYFNNLMKIRDKLSSYEGNDVDILLVQLTTICRIN